MLVNIRAKDVPPLIRKTAEEIAGVFYEQSRTDQFRKEAGAQRYFIRRHWRKHVEQAIESLSVLLGMKGIPDDQKTVIYDAITEFYNRSYQGRPKGLIS